MTRDELNDELKAAVEELVAAVEATARTTIEAEFKAAIVRSWHDNGRARTVQQGADMAWEATRHLFKATAHE